MQYKYWQKLEQRRKSSIVLCSTFAHCWCDFLMHSIKNACSHQQTSKIVCWKRFLYINIFILKSCVMCIVCILHTSYPWQQSWIWNHNVYFSAHAHCKRKSIAIEQKMSSAFGSNYLSVKKLNFVFSLKQRFPNRKCSAIY